MSLIQKATKPEGIKQKKPHILLYGKPGSGKTYAALDFPNTIYIDTENGATLPHYTDKLLKSGGMYFGTEHGSGDFTTVVNLVKELATTKHQYKTLVIDSLSKIFNDEIAKEAERLLKSGQGTGYGADKKPAVALTRRLINWISKLDMNVIIISHAKNEYEGDKQVGYIFDAYEKIEYELDLCLEVFKQGKSRRARVRKTRLLEFPEADAFDWSYKEFASRWGEDVITAVPEQVELVTPEKLNQLNTLLHVVRPSQEQITRWLDLAKVDKWEELPEQEADKLITYLTNKGK
jgi:DNA polymerase III delta prime subunit